MKTWVPRYFTNNPYLLQRYLMDNPEMTYFTFHGTFKEMHEHVWEYYQVRLYSDTDKLKLRTMKGLYEESDMSFVMSDDNLEDFIYDGKLVAYKVEEFVKSMRKLNVIFKYARDDSLRDLLRMIFAKYLDDLMDIIELPFLDILQIEGMLDVNYITYKELKKEN